jgi:hypothetical protein
VAELVATSELQRRAADYAAAWVALGQAARAGPRNTSVRLAREGLAQEWLDNARTGGVAPTFTALADTLSPVLTEGLLLADSSRKADLLTHLGWADFLRRRDGRRDLYPPTRYWDALAVDPRNPFAHAMLGHWILWQGDSLGAAALHFAEALGSGRQRGYVRRMQLSALENRRLTSTAIEMIRVASDMRLSGDSMPADSRDRLWAVFSSAFLSPAPDPSPSLVLAAVPPADLLATYRWLFDEPGYAGSKGARYTYQLARLQEAVGDTVAALGSYRAALGQQDADGYAIPSRITTAVIRLSGRH